MDAVTEDEIRSAWAAKGDLARAAAFRVSRDLANQQVYLIADFSRQKAFGKTRSLTQRIDRACEALPLTATRDDIEHALGRLHTNLAAATES